MSMNVWVNVMGVIPLFEPDVPASSPMWILLHLESFSVRMRGCVSIKWHNTQRYELYCICCERERASKRAIWLYVCIYVVCVIISSHRTSSLVTACNKLWSCFSSTDSSVYCFMCTTQPTYMSPREARETRERAKEQRVLTIKTTTN